MGTRPAHTHDSLRFKHRYTVTQNTTQSVLTNHETPQRIVTHCLVTVTVMARSRHRPGHGPRRSGPTCNVNGNWDSPSSIKRLDLQDAQADCKIEEQMLRQKVRDAAKAKRRAEKTHAASEPDQQTLLDEAMAKRLTEEVSTSASSPASSSEAYEPDQQNSFQRGKIIHI